MDDQELYDDLLAMQGRATRAGFPVLAQECYDFRMELLDRYYRSIDPWYVAACGQRIKDGIGWKP